MDGNGNPTGMGAGGTPQGGGDFVGAGGAGAGAGGGNSGASGGYAGVNAGASGDYAGSAGSDGGASGAGGVTEGGSFIGAGGGGYGKVNFAGVNVGGDAASGGTSGTANASGATSAGGEAAGYASGAMNTGGGTGMIANSVGGAAKTTLLSSPPRRNPNARNDDIILVPDAPQRSGGGGKRKYIIFGVVAAVVLIACGVVTVVLTSGSGGSNGGTASTSTSTGSSETTSAAAEPMVPETDLGKAWMRYATFVTEGDAREEGLGGEYSITNNYAISTAMDGALTERQVFLNEAVSLFEDFYAIYDNSKIVTTTTTNLINKNKLYLQFLLLDSDISALDSSNFYTEVTDTGVDTVRDGLTRKYNVSYSDADMREYAETALNIIASYINTYTILVDNGCLDNVTICTNDSTISGLLDAETEIIVANQDKLNKIYFDIQQKYMSELWEIADIIREAEK